MAPRKKKHEPTMAEKALAAGFGKAPPRDPALDAALAWLDKNWKFGITRESLVRGVVAAYQEAANAKR